MAKILLRLVFLFTFAVLVAAFITRALGAMNTFEWLPTESAPTDYLMFIVKGDLFFADGTSLYIPDRRQVHNGWGLRGSTHDVGDTLKPLPTRLQLAWFSFVEDRFYGGRFDLPTNRLQELFSKGTASPDGNQRLPYDRIIIGMAPGGDVSVWVGARRIVKEVATFRAQPAELPWTSVLDNPTVTRAEYIALSLQDALSPEVLKRVQSTPVPVGRWAQFAHRFPWVPRLQPGVVGHDLWIKGLNAEVEWLDLTGTRKDVDAPPPDRGAPRELSLYWRTARGLNLSADITFDENESMAAFAKLASVRSTDPMTLLLEPADTATTVDVLLQRGKIVYRFEHLTVKIYSVR